MYRFYILFTLSGKSIHLAGKVYKYFSDLAGKVYTFSSDEMKIAFLCGKLGKVDKILGMSLGTFLRIYRLSLIFHIRILYTFL